MKRKEISSKNINLSNRPNNAREKYLEDKVDYEDYQLIKNKSKKKINALETDLQNQKLTRKNTDIKTKLDQVKKVLPNLCQLYTKGDSETKKR